SPTSASRVGEFARTCGAHGYQARMDRCRSTSRSDAGFWDGGEASMLPAPRRVDAKAAFRLITMRCGPQASYANMTSVRRANSNRESAYAIRVHDDRRDRVGDDRDGHDVGTAAGRVCRG